MKAGDRYGKLVILKFVDSGPFLQCLCKCDCGTTKLIRRTNLKQCRGGTKSCSCLKHDAETFARSKRIRPLEARYNKLVDMAAKRGIAVNLSYESYVEFSSEGRCHYCHVNIDWAPHCTHNSMKGYNLDRTNSGVGYVKENLVVCCARCNRGKGNWFSYDEWWKMTACFREEFYENRSIGGINEEGTVGGDPSISGTAFEGGQAQIPAVSPEESQ